MFLNALRNLAGRARATALFTLAAATAAAQPIPAKVAHVPSRATLVPLSANWRMDGDIPVHSLLISLQGLVNRTGPQLYLEYPTNWQWEIVRPLETFMEKRHGMTFDRLPMDDANAALDKFAGQVKGYVVWDDQVRTSLIVAFTAAGVLDGVVVDEKLIPLAEQHGLRQLADFRGKFEGKSDAQIFQWAKQEYWDKCSRDYYTLMGGHAAPEMQPGLADFGIRQRAFFTNLSANPKHPEELALEKWILSHQNPGSIVLGWHPYGKDTEGLHTTLTSSYGLKMEGLHNLPNVSFTCQIPFTPDFKFENNHHVAPGQLIKVEPKVYIAAVSTDSIGVGAWTKPGRGSIPYAWQVMMNWSWMNPPALQYFYESKTPNDYFIGGLSGPGYMYPSAIPPEKFHLLMKDARSEMSLLDLRVMEIMDYSEGNRQTGNTDLPKAVVDRYYQDLPDAAGFINGYGAARTYERRGNRPMISYDYYLDPARPEDQAAADLEELIHLNPQRPYFMLLHIRETSSVEHVASILHSMSEPSEVVPLDVFLNLAGQSKTYRPHFRETTDWIDAGK